MENFALPVAITVGIIAVIILFLYIRLNSKHSRLKAALDAKVSMEQQLQHAQLQGRTQQQKQTEQIKVLTIELANAQNDLTMIRQQNDSQHANLREQNHRLTEQNKRFEFDLERLQEEKQSLEKDFIEANRRWKQERQGFEQEVSSLRKTLEQKNLEITSADDSGTGELQKWQEKCRDLQTQQEQLQNLNKSLQNKLNSQSQWAAQVQQALEGEIAQLNERLAETQKSVAE